MIEFKGHSSIENIKVKVYFLSMFLSDPVQTVLCKCCTQIAPPVCASERDLTYYLFIVDNFRLKFIHKGTKE